MKGLHLVICCIVFNTAFSQVLQLHYDGRHSLDPLNNNRNFVSLYFEYFKTQDSGKAFIKPGSFLLKMQADFSGQKSNMSQSFIQVSQTFRCWKPKIFVNLQYNGGLGVTEPKQYSYYITNTYLLGVSYPFKWGTAYLTSVLDYRYVFYNKASHDVMYTLYWWKGFLNYKAELAGDFSIWTENKNHQDIVTESFSGKRFYFFAEPQFWYKIANGVSVGTKINMYYHALKTDNKLQAYPTVAVKCKL